MGQGLGPPCPWEMGGQRAGTAAVLASHFQSFTSPAFVEQQLMGSKCWKADKTHSSWDTLFPPPPIAFHTPAMFLPPRHPQDEPARDNCSFAWRGLHISLTHGRRRSCSSGLLVPKKHPGECSSLILHIWATQGKGFGLSIKCWDLSRG